MSYLGIIVCCVIILNLLAFFLLVLTFRMQYCTVRTGIVENVAKTLELPLLVRLSQPRAEGYFSLSQIQ